MQHALKSWYVLVAGAFLVVYACSLTFVYVEGDDAASIAYHLLGRDAEIQPPYKPYQSMADVMLSVLPAQESLLRIVSILITSIAAICMVILLLTLVFDWIGRVSRQQRLLVAGLVLLAAPEFFYLGLVYSPTIIAMCFLLAAHLLARRSMRATAERHIFTAAGWRAIVLSLVLFGIGVAFRWTTLVYGAVIFADLVAYAGRHRLPSLPSLRIRLAAGVAWGVLALLAAYSAILVSGYNLVTLVLTRSEESVTHVQSVMTQTGAVQAGGYLYSIAAVQPLLTPALSVLALVGLVALLRRRDMVLWPLAASMLVGAPWMLSGVPKFMIVSLPAMILCTTVGMLVVWYGIERTSLRRAVQVALVVLLLVPWVFGVQVTREGSARGPGFEIRPFDRTTDSSSLRVAIGEGTAIPTPEGPRSLYGHAMTLLGGQWRALVAQKAQERRRVVEQALERDVPMILTMWSPGYLVNELAARGFTTNDPYWHQQNWDVIPKRRFYNASGDQVTLIFHQIQREVSAEQAQHITELAGADTDTVVWYGYPRTMRHLYAISPAMMNKIDSMSAVLDMDRLRAEMDVASGER